ncbi:MAG: hypothetical protein ABEI52_00880, partial [Halobacteriaceae archaeon]
MSYRGLLGAFPFAYRASESRIFRAYVVLASLLGGLMTLFILMALVVELGRSASAPGGVLTLYRAFLIILGLVAVGPLIAPVLMVARRYRHGNGAREYDASVSIAGLIYAMSLYLALVASAPEGL